MVKIIMTGATRVSERGSWRERSLGKDVRLDAYINTITGASPAIKRAAIVDGTNGSVWARTQDANTFSATEAELKKFVLTF
ncbi:Profilin-2 [Parelaphostrongylus tenuis]|uniref:Profilin-2 n=1 Tax=Parelaphostrongylus tenuis TaxID=148309 RepID=A0AAD5MHT7_PARTN|nr:Profilin-2 [Parelaphostrongylus tenuis]